MFLAAGQAQMAQRASAQVIGGMAGDARKAVVDECDRKRIDAIDATHDHESLGRVFHGRAEQPQLFVGVLEFARAFLHALLEIFVGLAQLFFEALALEEFRHRACMSTHGRARAQAMRMRVSGQMFLDTRRWRHDETAMLAARGKTFHFRSNQWQSETFLAPARRVAGVHHAHGRVAAFVFGQPRV
jgi:hypothetical protein